MIVRRRRVRDDACHHQSRRRRRARARTKKKRESHRSGQHTKRRQRTPRSALSVQTASVLYKTRTCSNKKRKKKTTQSVSRVPKLAKIKVVSAAIKHAPPKAAPHGFFSAHAPKCADASTTAQIPSASFADTSGGRIIADIPARNLLLLLGRRLRLKVTVFGRPVVVSHRVSSLCLLKTSSSSSSNLDGNARNEERGRVRVLFDGETRDSSVAFGETTSRKESAHFDGIFLTGVLKVLRNAAFFFIARTLVPIEKRTPTRPSRRATRIAPRRCASRAFRKWDDLGRLAAAASSLGRHHFRAPIKRTTRK